MNTIKVIQIIDSLNPGGAEVLAVNIANGLQEVAIESHLCVTRKEGLLRGNLNDEVGFLFLNKKARFDLKAIHSLKNYIKKYEIQIIHAHSTSYFIAFCVKILLPRIKIVWHDHYGNSDYLEVRKKQPIKLLSNYFSVIIAVNKNLVNWSKKYLKTNNVIQLNNFAYFNVHTEKTVLKGKEGKRIVHLAAFRKQKNHLNLLKAFHKVQKNIPEATLHLIGKGNNDEYEQSIYDYIAVKKLEKNVFCYGACCDIKNILDQATIGVLSSDSEGLPLSLLEYGLANLAVVITNVGDCNEVVKNNKSGIIVPRNNSLELSVAINSLFESHEKRNKYSKALRLEILNNYSKESYISQLSQMYYTLF